MSRFRVCVLWSAHSKGCYVITLWEALSQFTESWKTLQLRILNVHHEYTSRIPVSQKALLVATPLFRQNFIERTPTSTGNSKIRCKLLNVTNVNLLLEFSTSFNIQQHMLNQNHKIRLKCNYNKGPKIDLYWSKSEVHYLSIYLFQISPSSPHGGSHPPRSSSWQTVADWKMFGEVVISVVSWPSAPDRNRFQTLMIIRLFPGLHHLRLYFSYLLLASNYKPEELHPFLRCDVSWLSPEFPAMKVL